MTSREAFEIWAPENSKWANWVRPALFVMNDFGSENQSGAGHYINDEIPVILYLNEILKDTAVFLDLPDYYSINEGLALAKMGWRPVPLFNGTNEQTGAMALVDNHGIKKALIWGVGVLRSIDFEENAPPVFLLDSNRRHRYKMNVSIFDNSWDLYSQDIPSAEYFLDSGIRKIIIRGEKIEKDLKVIFQGFQKKGIKFYLTNGYEEAKAVRIRRKGLDCFASSQ